MNQSQLSGNQATNSKFGFSSSAGFAITKNGSKMIIPNHPARYKTQNFDKGDPRTETLP